MLIDLILNGEHKMTVEVDVEGLSYGKKVRKLCGLLGVDASKRKGLKFNLTVEEDKFFEVTM